VYIEAFGGNLGVFRHMRRPHRAILIEREQAQYGLIRDTFHRPPAVTVIHGDALEFIGGYQWTGREFGYFDPPYILETRKGQRDLYTHELTLEDHNLFLAIATRIPCPVAISAYANPLYDRALADWRRIDFTATTRGGPATESLYMNYDEPMVLHDYQYLGDNYRERENIKKKARNWANRLQRQPRDYQRAIISMMMDQAPEVFQDALQNRSSTSETADE
jgi:hypothetical protein